MTKTSIPDKLYLYTRKVNEMEKAAFIVKIEASPVRGGAFLYTHYTQRRQKMDVTDLRKAFGLMTRGMMEKDELREKYPGRYPYSRDLHHGMNLFLAACLEMGGMGKEVFSWADEEAFLEKYICRPIKDWFEDWDEDACTRFALENQPFYGYGAFAYRVDTNVYMASSECMEYLETQEANIIEGTDEHALYEQMLNLSQEKYVLVRRYLIEHPVITLEERRNILYEVAEDAAAREALQFAYEEFSEQGYRCPACGWTMMKGKYDWICHSPHCMDNHPDFSDKRLLETLLLDGTKEQLYRLKKGIMRYFAQPGKLELEIEEYCRKKGIQTQLWPQMDRYDVEITFPDQEIWEIDAKAYRNPVALRSRIEADESFVEGNFARGYYVIPTEYTHGQNNYVSIVNQGLRGLDRVSCVTVWMLKREINRKMRECSEEK